MSEMGEVPLTPQERGEPPQVKRLEDMPEFQKLAPEQQERILTLRERMREQAMNPRDVVTRSINEMGFWEGMGATLKPHMQRYKEIKIKDLKASASLALSLLPVLGEGKGLGTGLLGITAKEGKALTGASKLKNIQFEPFVRGKRVLESAKAGYKYAGRYSAVEHVRKAAELAGKKPGLLKNAGAHIEDAFRPVKSIFSAKGFAEQRAVHDFTKVSREGSTVIAKKLGVVEIQAAQRAGQLAEKTAYLAKKAALTTDAIKNRRWFDLPKHWKARGIEIAAKRARKDAAKVAKESMKMVLEPRFANRKLIPGQKWVESQALKTVPKVIEGTKFGRFHTFFDKWLNLTPDVPVWLSTTTGVMEFLGAHGIDAIPAVLQLGKNMYDGAKLTTDMALDVVKYSATRGLQKLAERKQAAEVFASAAVPAAQS